MILSMDAEQAFDRTEPSSLFETLRVMNFGDSFIRSVKKLFMVPDPGF